MRTGDPRDILIRDLDPDFLEAAAVGIAWAYDDLFERLRAEDGLPDCCREYQFNQSRGAAAVAAVARAAKKLGVPFEFRRLPSNGQQKLLVKSGRVVLILEAVRSLSDHPCASGYKKELAELHSYVRQLELNLRDQPARIHDWGGEVLAVLLHGPAGDGFTHERKALGALTLAIPDSAYSQWTSRLDLQAVAMFGRGTERVEAAPTAGKFIQADQVRVTLKAAKVKMDSAG